ncbi:MAG: oligosaccharide flippase family protein [Thermoguttaceae bacterium]
MNEIPNHSNEAILKRLLTGAGFSLFNLFLAIGISLFMTPFLLNNIGVRQMGMWEIVGSFTGFYGLLDFGITSAVSRYITIAFTKKDVDGCNSFASIGYFIFTCVGAVAALVSFCIAGGMYTAYSGTVDDINVLCLVTMILGVNFMVDFPLRVFAGVISGCLRSDVNQLRALFFRILGAAMTFAIVFYGGKIIFMALGTLVLTLLNTVSFYLLAKKVFPQLRLSRQCIRKDDFKPLFSYSTVTFWAQITDVLRFRISTIIIAGFLSISTVAHYAIAARLVGYFQSVVGNCTDWMASWFTRLHANDEHDTILSYLKFSYKITIVVSNFIAFGLIFWSIPFITRWVGPQFLDCYDALVLLTFGMTFALWQSPAIKVLYAIAQHHFYAKVNTVDAIINVVGTLIFVQLYGMTGVAMGNFFAMLVTKMIVQPEVIIRVMKISRWEFWVSISSTLMRSLLCLLLPYWFSTHLAVPEYKYLFLNGFLCFICYFVSAYFICLTKMEREKIFSVVMMMRHHK